MRLIIICAALCFSVGAGSDSSNDVAVEQKNWPLKGGMETRYTLLAQSKDYNNREPELSQQNTEIISKPWRRWAYGYPGNSQPAVPPNLNLLGALINLPGLLMIGVNLGALLYLLLGILGLTPPRSWPASHPHDFYRNNRHIVDDDGVDGGKETSVYF